MGSQERTYARHKQRCLETVRHLYLPTGTWYNYWTKQPYHSHGEWIEHPADLETMPVYVKEGSLLPYTTLRQHTHNEIGPIERLEIYGTMDAQFTYNDGSTNFEVKMEQGKAKLTGLEQPPELTIYTNKKA